MLTTLSHEKFLFTFYYQAANSADRLNVHCNVSQELGSP